MYCPNPDCPERLLPGELREYVQTVVVCPICSTPLVAEAPNFPSPAIPAREAPPTGRDLPYWREYRSRRALHWSAFFASIPFVFVVMVLLEARPQLLGVKAVAALVAAYSLFSLWVTYRFTRWPCPRCKRPFHTWFVVAWAFNASCLHCWLPLWETVAPTDSPDLSLQGTYADNSAYSGWTTDPGVSQGSPRRAKRPASVWLHEGVLLAMAVVTLVSAVTTLAQPRSVMVESSFLSRAAPYLVVWILRVILPGFGIWMLHTARPIGRFLAPAILFGLFGAPSLLSALEFLSSNPYSPNAESIGAFSASLALGTAALLLGLRVAFGKKERAYFQTPAEKVA